MSLVKKESESREMSYWESEQVVRARIFVLMVTHHPGNDWPGAITLSKCWKDKGASNPLTMVQPCTLARVSLSGQREEGLATTAGRLDRGGTRGVTRGEGSRRESEAYFLWTKHLELTVGCHFLVQSSSREERPGEVLNSVSPSASG